MKSDYGILLQNLRSVVLAQSIATTPQAVAGRPVDEF